MTTEINNKFDTSESEILAAKLKDAETPAYLVSFDPDEAEKLGAFEELALSESEALESSIDVD